MSLDRSSVDAFGRQRTSEPFTLFDSRMTVDKRPDLYDEVTTGSGTSSAHNTNQSSVTLSVADTTAGSIARQSHFRQNYQPGKSQLVKLTAVVGVAGSGITKRLGVFDDRNGFFFQYSDGVWSVGIRSYTSGSADDTLVAQGDWSRGDWELDPTMAQIFVIDYQWLGVGIVRFGFCLPGGLIEYVHIFENPNSLAEVYLQSPNLPVRYEIENDGTGSASDLVQICSAVDSEGGTDFTGRALQADRGISPLTTGNNTTLYPILAMRLRSTYWRFGVVTLTRWSCFTDSATALRAALLVNPTLAGDALSYSAAATESAVEVATPGSGTTITDEGTLCSSFYAESANQSPIQDVSSAPGAPLQLGVTPAGLSDVFVVAAQNISNSATDFFATTTWREIV